MAKNIRLAEGNTHLGPLFAYFIVDLFHDFDVQRTSNPLPMMALPQRRHE